MGTGVPEGTTGISRRHALLSGLGAFGFLALGANAQTSVVQPRDLKPGEFIWMPEVSPTGGVAIVVSLPDQLVHVYRGGIRIAVSTCSTGAVGHETPTGIFTILEKDRDHYSNLYDDAPMPNMNRLTWSGVALHAGHLPGYPASHGCIRLPRDFSDKLYGVTHIGTPVIIAGKTSDPWNLTHPGLLLTGSQADQFEGKVDALGRKAPTEWRTSEDHPVRTLIASSADRTVQLLENGRVIDQSELYIAGSPQLGEHLLTLEPGLDGRWLMWTGVTQYSGRMGASDGVASALRINATEAFNQRLLPLVQQGMMLVITDYPLSPDRRSEPGFTILTS